MRPAIGPGAQQVVRPDQPVRPQVPTIERRPAAPAQAPAPPFILTPQEQAELDRVLRAWEQRGAKLKMFECDFTRWEYDPVFAEQNKNPNDLKFEDHGNLKYAAPDKGLFYVKEPREEKWVSDGRSIFQYNFNEKKLVEYKLPPEFQGKEIANGPLPFLFGAKAENLTQRYFLRIVTPADVQGQIWLKAVPRFQVDAADFSQARVILTADDMLPFALQVYSPNGKSHTVYRFYNIVLNNPLRILNINNPFQASTPWGWKKTVEEPRAPAQAGRAVEGRR